MRRRDLIAALQNQPLDVIARLLEDAGYEVRHYHEQSVQEHGGGMLTMPGSLVVKALALGEAHDGDR